MDGATGGVARHNDFRPALLMPADFLESIDEERSSRLEHDAPQQCAPSPKRMRTGFECERCGKSFTEKRSLVRHSKHAVNCKPGDQSLKPFACGVCSKGFTRDDVRQRHENEKHYNVKRRQRGLNLLPTIRLGSSGRSVLRGIAPALQSADSSVHESPTDTSTPPSIGNRGSYSLGDSTQSPNSSALASTPFSIFTEGTNVFSKSPTSIYGSHKRRWSSTTESDASLGSSPKLATTNASFTTYSSDGDRRSIVTETSAFESKTSVDADSLATRRTSFDLSRRDLIRSGASARPASRRDSHICPICNGYFGSTVAEVRSHLDRHCPKIDGEHTCEVCRIGFANRADLDLHLMCADRGHCGLPFVHSQDCTGHHPRNSNASSLLSDGDRMRLTYYLRSWEQSQLHDFIATVTNLLENASFSPKSEDLWSVDGVIKSIQSLSIQNSGGDVRSTPSHLGHRARIAMSRARRYVSNQRLIGPEASFHIRLGKKSPNYIRLGTALVEAAAEGNLLKMNELLIRGADVNGAFTLRQGSAACSPLAAAVCSGNIGAIKFLLEREAEVDGPRSNDDITVAPPLYLAAASGDVEIVRMLLDNGAKVNKRALKNAGHAACAASRHGYSDVLSILIKHGANLHLQACLDIDTEDTVDDSVSLPTANVLGLAVYHGRLNTVQMLLNHETADLDYCDHSAALALAAYQGNMAMIELLLGTHPLLCSFYAMWIADSQGHKAAVDMFISKQRANNLPLPLQSPRILLKAINQDQEDLASRMLSSHDGPKMLCDLNQFACRNCESRLAYALVAQAHSPLADMNDFNLAMGLNCAVYYGDLEAAQVLLAAGLRGNEAVYPSKTRLLDTNLTLASRLGHSAMVELLLYHVVEPT